MHKKLYPTLLCFFLFSECFSQWMPVTVSPLKVTETFQAIHAVSANTWIATGWFQSIARTTDFGNSWSIVDSGDVAGTLWEDIDFADANVGFLVGSTSAISKTTNGGLTWQPILTDFNMHQTPLGVKCKSSTEIWIVGSEGSITKSTNAGVTWDSIISLPTNYSLNKINFFDAMNGIIVGDYGTVFVTSDGGAHWQSVSTSFTSNIVNLSILNSTTCIITHSTGIYKSTDKGQTWNPCNVNATVEFSGVSFPTANTGYAISDTKVFKSTDGGSNWSLQRDMGLFHQLTGIYLYDDLHGMIGSQYNTLYTTNDGGGTLNAINDMQADEATFFPNPVLNVLNIKASDLQPELIYIYDVDGKRIVEDKYKTQIDVSLLSSGIYFVELKTADFSIRRKFIKL